MGDEEQVTMLQRQDALRKIFVVVVLTVISGKKKIYIYIILSDTPHILFPKKVRE